MRQKCDNMCVNREMKKNSQKVEHLRTGQKNVQELGKGQAKFKKIIKIYESSKTLFKKAFKAFHKTHKKLLEQIKA